ncbi:MAG: PEP-utilizing enzyme [Acidimicrobiales bacterium]
MVDRWVVETKLSERYPVYTRANVGEVFPDPVTPLSFSLAFQNEDGLQGSELGFRDGYVRMGGFDDHEFDQDECVFLGVFGGYCYLNASAMRLFGARAPGMTAQDIDDQFFGLQPGIPPYEEQPGDQDPDKTARIGETFAWAFSIEQLDDALEDAEAMRQLRAERPDVKAMSNRELVSRGRKIFDDHFRRLFGRHLFVTGLAAVPVAALTEICAAVGRPGDTLKLIAGVGDVESAAPSAAMWELGRIAASSTALSGEFEKGVKGLVGRIEALEDPAAAKFMEGFEQFLYDFGSRGPNEWESSCATWEVEPELALSAIDRMRLSPDSASPLGHQAERAAEREQISAEISAMLEANPEVLGQFQAALRAARVFMAGRERTKTNCVKMIQETRVLFYEFGQREVDAGRLSQIADFAMLTWSEVQQYLDDPEPLLETIRERRAQYEELRQLQEPFVVFGEVPPISSFERRDAIQVEIAQVGDQLQGMPGCPGISQGRARVVLDSHDPTALAPGDVLVAPLTDPSWTPLFVPAAGVIVDVGAPLSHAIIVSRELGIPCVVSVTGATRKIPDGALVEVNGDTGVITILET